MAWFRKERKRRKAVREPLDIPPDAWEKCGECGFVDLAEKFETTLQVCPECGHHRRIGASRYIEILTDPDSFEELYGDLRSVDALKFEGYADKITKAEKRAGSHDAILTGHAKITRMAVNIGAMEFACMGGSMGSVVGEKTTRLALRSLEKKVPLVIISASGGARMQEGVLSLMQMAKTSAAISRLRQEGIPFISILTNPTTGGVTASYAMLGDVNIAEPGALIGFAGPRVIQQTINQDLPEGFQTAEFLVEHGMVDRVVPRSELRSTTASLLRMMKGLKPVGANA
jgi:acetyl-CoA carboxylase carboxyl transferase subunit beta